MIKKMGDYDQTEEHGIGFKTLPSGGYVCKIIDAGEEVDKNGNPMIHIAFDIAEGEYTGYFHNLFQKRKEKNLSQTNPTKYPFEGQSWIQVTDFNDRTKTSPKFKGFCTSLEKSGTMVWMPNGQFDTPRLRGALVGVIYQNQEKEYEGKTSWRAVPWGFRDIEAIRSGDYFVPKDKELPKQNNSYGYGDSFSQPQQNPFGNNPFGNQPQPQSQPQNNPFGQAQNFGQPQSMNQAPMGQAPMGQPQNNGYVGNMADQFAQVDDGLGAFYPDANDEKIPF